MGIHQTLTLAAARCRWRKATTLHHLANIQADRLTRARTRTEKNGRAAIEGKMFSTLIALGRAGVVVHDWRPGTFAYDPDFDATMETRACIVGFADDETKDWLDNLLYFAAQKPGATKYTLNHIFELYGPGCPEYDRSGGDDDHRARGNTWVERFNTKTSARLGEQMTAEQIHRAFPTRPAVAQELRDAWQITIAAPDWGHTRMWDDLLHMIAESDTAASTPTS